MAIKLDQIKFVLRGHYLLFSLTILVFLLSSAAQSLSLAVLYPLATSVANPNASDIGLLRNINQYLFEENSLVILLIEICIIIFFSFVLNYFSTILSRAFAFFIKQSLSEKVFNKYLSNNYLFFLHNKQGVLLNNLITETDRARSAVLFLSQYVRQIILAISYIVLLSVFSWKSTLILLVVFGFFFLIVRKTIFAFSEETGKKRVELSQEISSIAAETINGIKQVKLCNYAEIAFCNMRDKLKKFRNLMIVFTAVRQLPEPVIMSFMSLSAMLVLILNMKFIFFNVIEILPLVITVMLISVKLFNILSSLLEMHMNIISYLPSINVIYNTLHQREQNLLEAQHRSKTRINQIKDGIEIKNFTFSYPGKKNLYYNLNLTFRKGDKIGITGYSGSGKSSLVNILSGLLDYESGEILIDGKSLKEIDIHSYREKIGIVSQDIFHFHRSILENIRIGNVNATKEEIVEAAKLANAHEFIMRLPNGYDSIIGERGTSLSGGESQRIAIARVLVNNPGVLMFDEATNALDKESERLIIETINSLKGDKIVIIIAHNLNIIVDCNVIYFFDKGKIVEFGSHEELLKARKDYSVLFNSVNPKG
jgi:ATP-binding cassette, subfamily B, bacterial MsbA